MEVLGGLVITSPWDLECKKVKTTQAGCRAHEKQNLALSSLLSYGKSRHGEKPHIWDSLDPDRYVGIETKFCFRTVNTYLSTCQTVFVHIHKITFKWLATMQVYIFPRLLSQKQFSLQ